MKMRRNAHLRVTIFAVFVRPERLRYKKLFFGILTLYTRRKKREIYESETFMTCGRNLLLTRLEKHSKITQLALGPAQ